MVYLTCEDRHTTLLGKDEMRTVVVEMLLARNVNAAVGGHHYGNEGMGYAEGIWLVAGDGGD